MNFANGSPVHISWQASDNGTISKVELYYAEDGQPFTLITDSLSNNSSNSSACSYSAPRTGCYLWNSIVPNDVFFKLQIRVTDNQGQTSQVTSLIAGNGTNTSVNFGVAANAQGIKLGNWAEPNAFATNPANGDIYMNCAQNDVPITPPSTYTAYHSLCRLNRATGLWEQIMN